MGSLSKRARLNPPRIARTVQSMSTDKSEQVTLEEEMDRVLQEARVVLPGIQALFGFQTIAVFNQRFVDLPDYAKECHLFGLGMVIIAVALVMTPAVYYRCVGREHLSRHVLRRASTLIVGALAPLACGLALDIFTVVLMATDNRLWSLLSAILALVFLVFLWFAFPLAARRRARRHSNARM